MKKSIAAVAAAVFAAALFTSAPSAISFADHHEGDGQPKPKHAIKDVMKAAMMPFGKGLVNKVASGQASEEEKKMFLDLTISVVENTPPKGDATSWQMKSGRLALAAAKVAVGRDGAEKELQAAANCKACHDAHRPPAEQQ